MHAKCTSHINLFSRELSSDSKSKIVVLPGGIRNKLPLVWKAVRTGRFVFVSLKFQDKKVHCNSRFGSALPKGRINALSAGLSFVC